jgi:hypothetical protein
MGLISVFDSSVLINMIDSEHSEFGLKANHVYHFLTTNKVEIVYTNDVKIEVLRKSTEKMNEFLNSHRQIPYFVGVRTWDEIEATWDDIGSVFNDNGEEHIDIVKYLKRTERSMDDGILNDAICYKADLFVHFNPKDYNRLPEDFWKKNRVLNMDLKSLSIEEIEIKLNELFENVKRT